jgi:hypothetical protein
VIFRESQNFNPETSGRTEAQANTANWFSSMFRICMPEPIFRSQLGPICLKGIEAYVVNDMEADLLVGEAIHAHEKHTQIADHYRPKYIPMWVDDLMIKYG